jgi:AraC-like DNA-binding protein
VGLESAATLRAHFARALGISPTAYRRRFFTATTGRVETERRFI